MESATQDKIQDKISSVNETWTELISHLNQWFYKPDLEALEIVLSAVAAHYVPQTDPIWLFIIGPASTGKTAITINPLYGIKNAYPVSDLSPKAFLSGRGPKRNSLLHRVGESGILLFKDFTTVISKRENDRMEVASHLREIYDGSFSRDTGTGKVPTWKGKITVIAACTPAIERAWGIMHELGERFIHVRWPRQSGPELIEMAQKQIGHEKMIEARSQKLVRAILDRTTRVKPTPLTKMAMEKLEPFSELLAQLRCRVIRDSSHGARRIIDVPEPEAPTRIYKALDLLVRFHAQIFHGGTVTSDSLRIARRIVIDSVPKARTSILLCIPNGSYQSRTDLTKMTKMPYSTVAWNLEEMVALGVLTEEITRSGDNENINYRLTESFDDLWNRAMGDWDGSPNWD